MQLFGSCLGFASSRRTSLLEGLDFTPAASSTTKGDIYTYLVRIQNFLFHFPFDEIYRRMLFFTLGRSVSAWIDYSTTKWNRQTRQHQGKRICTFPRLPCPSTKRHVMLNLTSAAAAAASTALRTAGWSCSVLFTFSSNSLAKATWWWMLLYRTLRKVPGTTKVRLLEKTCESWVQDVLLLLSLLLWCSDDRRKNTRTGTPWWHRRLTTAGIKVARHYHQLLVRR